MILLDFGLSPFAQKVRITLREKGLAFESLKAFAPEHQERFRKASPRMELPALIDGEAAICDSTTILDYLEERYPDPPLMPADPFERARVRMLEELCDTQFESINYCVTEVVGFKRADGEQAATILANGKEQTARIFAYLEERLGDNEYFSGDSFGRADICVLPNANNAVVVRNPPQSERLQDWLDRVNARPAVAKTVAEAKESLSEFKKLIADVREGRAKRLYRDHRLEWMMRAGGVDLVLDGLKNNDIRFSTDYV